jgi:hypothetical protein
MVGEPLFREVPPIELLLPPGGPRVVEARGGEGPPQGILVLEDGSSRDLNSAEGTEAFLREAAPGLDPLAVILTLVRYRIPEHVGARAARLATREEDLDPALARPGLPLGLAVDGDRIAFTAAYDDPAGADRWTAVRGAAPSLTREAPPP